MKRIFDRSAVMLAGLISISVVGCITGTKTFSSVGVPSTQYCRNTAPEPVFDIPSTKVSEITLLNGDTPVDDEQTVISLKP